MNLKTHNSKIVSWNLQIGAMSLLRYNWTHRDTLVLLQPIEFEIAMDSSAMGHTRVSRRGRGRMGKKWEEEWRMRVKDEQIGERRFQFFMLFFQFLLQRIKECNLFFSFRDTQIFRCVVMELNKVFFPSFKP